MPFILADRVQETSTTAGTGSIALGGAATGYRTFTSVLSTGDTTFYTVADQGGANWEVGIGTFTAPSTLARTTILSSSNGGSIVTFGAGTKNVFITLPASRSNAGEAASTVQTTNIKNASFAGNSIVLDANGNATFAGTAVMASSFQRNRIINGNMGIAQRATSATVTAGTGVPTASTGYPCVDRFFVYSTGANVTAAQVAGTGANPFLLRITGAASVTAVGVGQRIESSNSIDLAGQTCTLSVELANSLLTVVTWTASYATTTDTFGTIGTPTKTQIATGTFAVNGTLTRYSANISIPAAATTGVEILFTVGAQTSGTWSIDNVQLEPGTIATPFERRQFGQELALCQRYFWRGLGRAGGSVPTASAVLAESWIAFQATMRATPTLVAGTPSLGNAASFTADAPELNGFRALVQSNAVIGNFSGSATVSASSEL